MRHPARKIESGEVPFKAAVMINVQDVQGYLIISLCRAVILPSYRTPGEAPGGILMKTRIDPLPPYHGPFKF
jgi:hypothetical protein